MKNKLTELEAIPFTPYPNGVKLNKGNISSICHTITIIEAKALKPFNPGKYITCLFSIPYLK